MLADEYLRTLNYANLHRDMLNTEHKIECTLSHMHILYIKSFYIYIIKYFN